MFEHKNTKQREHKSLYYMGKSREVREAAGHHGGFGQSEGV
jgi:hypothetical protein